MQGRGPGANVVPLNREQRAPTIAPFVPTYAASLEGKVPPPLDWLVPGVLLRGEVTLFAGATKLGKTFLCQDMMTAAALGRRWLGRDIGQFRSFGYFAEDREQALAHRQININRHYDISHADLETEVSWLSRDQIGANGGNARLCEFERFSAIPKMTPRWDQMVNFCKDTGVRVVPIDTSARTFGGDEVNRNQVTAYVEKLAWLADTLGGAILLNAHPNRSGGWYSGSSAWESTVRITISLERPKTYNRETGTDEDVRILYGMGSNYGSKLNATKLRWQDGVFVTEEMPERKRALSHTERLDLDYRMLAALRRLCGNGTLIPADPELDRSLPKRAKRSTPEYRDLPLLVLADSVERLVADGRIVKVEIRGNCILRPSDIKLPNEMPWMAI
ncbi:MAG TPA: AAA family ATPase [Bradyrhizobium sp.]|nr:AAA family ATPase [Bradyrhizobium sp.]